MGPVRCPPSRSTSTPLKEPIGFIKILQWIASIFAFATCGGFKGKTEILVNCPLLKVNENHTVEATFSYPFSLYR
uniref:Synaptophysin n=1 Tax=Urocitellus parryii TaxID=9999 RepID=A0A8D2HH55_UROPR